MKRTIEDVPYGHLGTVVGHTRADGTGSIIVGFDDIPHVRYLKRADLHRVAPAYEPALSRPAYRPQDGEGA